MFFMLHGDYSNEVRTEAFDDLCLARTNFFERHGYSEFFEDGVCYLRTPSHPASVQDIADFSYQLSMLDEIIEVVVFGSNQELDAYLVAYFGEQEAVA